ncbi:MAG: helix-turn-helix transcriptional regulator, partial [Haloferacaceae archaeon]
AVAARLGGTASDDHSPAGGPSGDGEADPSDAADEPETPGAGGGVAYEAISNEERVLRVLDDHGGRMRQSDVVDETDWSKAKVSRVLSRMEEEGEVVKIDVGRENVVARPEEVPRGANPPFEP